METMETASKAIEPTERFYIPHRKRLTHMYVTNEDGARELRIDYGLKEITFDDERMFAFGEGLVTTPSFIAESTTSWGPGYTWDEVSPLLEALLAEGILMRGDGSDEARPGGLAPSMLPASQCPMFRSWSEPECEAITRDLAKRPVEIGWIEAFVPVYRVAHAALDTDDRQVGEANTHPPQLRLDRETEWRVCQYPGSRYRDDAPMNVTALKAMIKHWKPMMTMILEAARAMRERFGPRDHWTIGELHILSSVILGIPAYALMKRGGSAPQPPLHPVLSSMIRITDGVRMTTDSMLFSIENNRTAGEPLSAERLFLEAEQRVLLVNDTGVCAGPNHLIREFLATLIDGVTAENVEGRELPPELRTVLDELQPALEYGLYGMQSWGLALAVYLDMTRTMQQLFGLLEGPDAADDPAAAQLLARLKKDIRVHDRMQITLDNDREIHLKMYQNAYEGSRQASRKPIGPATLAEAIAAVPAGPSHHAAIEQLRHALAAKLVRPALADQVARALIDYVRCEQGILASTTVVQHEINKLLERTQPTRPLRVRDFLVHWSLGSQRPGAFPYLLDSLDQELAIVVDCTQDAIEVSTRQAS